MSTCGKWRRTVLSLFLCVAVALTFTIPQLGMAANVYAGEKDPISLDLSEVEGNALWFDGTYGEFGFTANKDMAAVGDYVQFQLGGEGSELFELNYDEEAPVSAGDTGQIQIYPDPDAVLTEESYTVTLNVSYDSNGTHTFDGCRKASSYTFQMRSPGKKVR